MRDWAWEKIRETHDKNPAVDDRDAAVYIDHTISKLKWKEEEHDDDSKAQDLVDDSR